MSTRWPATTPRPTRRSRSGSARWRTARRRPGWSTGSSASPRLQRGDERLRVLRPVEAGPGGVVAALGHLVPGHRVVPQTCGGLRDRLGILERYDDARTGGLDQFE